MIVIKVHTLDNNWSDFEGTEPISLLEVEDSEMMSFPEDIHYKLKATLVTGGILVEGMVETKINAQCGRCLENFSTQIINNKVCHFYEDVTSDDLDITEDIREDLLLNLPINPLCSNDCQGICLTCGINLNKESCNCDDKNSGDDIWGDLDKIKFEK